MDHFDTPQPAYDRRAAERRADELPVAHDERRVTERRGPDRRAGRDRRRQARIEC